MGQIEYIQCYSFVQALKIANEGNYIRYKILNENDQVTYAFGYCDGDIILDN